MNDIITPSDAETGAAATSGERFVAALRAAAPYIHAHHDKCFVVVFGGEAAARLDFEWLIHDLALLTSLGVKLVLVHGARPQIDAQLAQAGIEAKFAGDMRITDSETMACVKAAVGGLRMDIEARLSTGLASTPMGGARLKVAGGNWITAKPVGIRSGIDHQLTGEVRRVDIVTIREVLAKDGIALLSPTGYSPTGEIFNLRAGDVAQAVASGLSADKLIFVLDSDPQQWQLARAAGDSGQLSVAAAEQLLAEGTDTQSLGSEDRAYVTAALAATRGSVRRVHLIGMGPLGSLLRELYTRDGCGLMFYAEDDYETTRDASIEDLGGIMALIAPLEAQGMLAARSPEQIEPDIEHFTVMIRDGAVIACAAMLPFIDESAGEFACVAVHPDYRGGRRARVLLARAETRARALGLTRLFCLTTHTAHWFIEKGFVPAQLDDLPAARRARYNFERNSRVFVKNL